MESHLLNFLNTQTTICLVQVVKLDEKVLHLHRVTSLGKSVFALIRYVFDRNSRITFGKVQFRDVSLNFSAR